MYAWGLSLAVANFLLVDFTCEQNSNKLHITAGIEVWACNVCE
jgi:hypothetical protein